MAFKTQAEWVAAQPDLTKIADPMLRNQTLESWQMQRPNYVDPINFSNYEQYIAAANPSYRMGTDASQDLRNQANFYGLTIENYQTALKGNEGGLSGNLSGSQLLSPLQRTAAETARAQGIAPMSPEVAALARANPDAFNKASQDWSNFMKTTFPKTLEYQSVLAGPTKYNVTSATPPKVSDVNSQFFVRPCK